MVNQAFRIKIAYRSKKEEEEKEKEEKENTRDRSLSDGSDKYTRAYRRALKKKKNFLSYVFGKLQYTF